MSTETTQQPGSVEDIEMEDKQIEAVYKFNQNPRKNIGALCEFYKVQQTPQAIAHLMRTTPGLVGSQIGDYLSRDGNQDILRSYFMEIDLKVPFLEAMRASLSGPMFLPGEAQQIDRVVQVFSNCYLAQNPGIFPNDDVPFTLAFALIMLNSDLHNPNMTRHMTEADFISNFLGALPKDSVQPETLAKFYNELKLKPFCFTDSSNKFMAMSAPKLKGNLRKRSKHFGARWTSHYFVLANSCLYYFKDDSTASGDQPLGNIQLIEVEVSRVPGYPNQILIHSRSPTGLQYVKFRKGYPPEIVAGLNDILLEAPDESSADKWFVWTRKSAILSGFKNEIPQITDNSDSKFGFSVPKEESSPLALPKIDKTSAKYQTNPVSAIPTDPNMTFSLTDDNEENPKKHRSKSRTKQASNLDQGSHGDTLAAGKRPPKKPSSKRRNVAGSVDSLDKLIANSSNGDGGILFMHENRALQFQNVVEFDIVKPSLGFSNCFYFGLEEQEAATESGK